MNDVVQSTDARRNRLSRVIILTLAILTAPALCCGGLQLLDALPSSWLPSTLDFTLNLFESTARVENKTSETLYITAITTTYGDAVVIPQNIAFRQRDIPVRAQSSVTLHYDSADRPLSGIVVCRKTDDCRLLPADNSGVYELNSYETLERLEPRWWQAIQAYPLHNYGTLVIAGFSVLPIVLFSSWIYLTLREKKAAA